MALVILKQIVKFVIMAGIGVLAVKRGILDDAGLNTIAQLVIRITLPLMSFTAILDGVTREQLFDTLVILPAGVGVVSLLYLLAVLTSRLLGLKGNRKRVYQAVSSMGNNGFMGIPLAVALFPQLGMLYSAVFSVVDQTACWTLGYYLCQPEEKEEKTGLAASLKKILNPCIVATVLAVVLLLAGLRLPELVESTLSTIGDVTSPLAMLYIGGLVAGLDFRRAFTTREFYLIPLVKMLLAPVITFLALRGLGVEEEITLYLTMITGTPSMASMAMIAQSSGSEGDYAAGAVLLTTLACVVTLPLVMLIVGLL